MKAAALPLLLALALVGCGGDSPTGPGTTPPPNIITLLSLSGTVTSSGAALAGATVTIADGVNQGQGRTTDTAGNYSFTNLTPSVFTLAAAASGHTPQNKAVNLTAGNQVVSFALVKPNPIFVRAGIGDTVFNLPAYVSRIKVTGDYTGQSSNFIVHCDGFSGFSVNELLGTSWGPTHFEGTYLTRGCTVVEILFSSGVSWSFTEVR